MYFLFVVMFLHDGTQIDHKYPDSMKYLECMSYARQEAEALKQEDTSKFKTIDFYCGTDADFAGEYGK